MENKKLNQEQVAGGYSLREKKKVETTAISDDTISRI